MPKKNGPNQKSDAQRFKVGKRVMQLSPPPENLEETKNKLPQFDLIELRSLLAETKIQTGEQTQEEKLLRALANRIKEQTEELVRSLGCDPANFTWQNAFIRLARI